MLVSVKNAQLPIPLFTWPEFNPFSAEGGLSQSVEL